MKFELLAGRHSNAQNRDFSKGDIIESSSDLTRSFPQKFKRRHDLEQHEAEKAALRAGNKPQTKTEKVVNVAPVAEQKDEAPSNDEGADEQTPQSEEKQPEASPFGENVTAQFPTAGKLQVFKNGKGKFNVVDSDEPGETVNPVPLKDAAAVNKLLAKVNA